MSEKFSLEDLSVSSFHKACKEGELGRVKAFVSANPSQIDEKSPEGWTGLIMACYSEHAQVVNFLVESGADINATNAKGTTVFMYAKTPIQNNHQDKTELLGYLLEKGADINRLDCFDKSVLDYVIENGATTLADWMVSRGALPGAEII